MRRTCITHEDVQNLREIYSQNLKEYRLLAITRHI
jgi:hypothetical protein